MWTSASLVLALRALRTNAGMAMDARIPMIATTSV
jgi:hypothetical protein